MNILILNSQKDKFYLNKLKKILLNYKKDKLYIYQKKINLSTVKKNNIKVIISFHYKYIVPSEILKFVKYNAFNFHNSYLPMNRGMYPVLWSAVSNKFAVCLHKMNNKIDQGKIIFRKEIKIHNNKSLYFAYNILEISSLNLFRKKWKIIRDKILSYKKIKALKIKKIKISYNNNFKGQVLLSTLNNGWNSKIKNVQKNYKLICRFYKI